MTPKLKTTLQKKKKVKKSKDETGLVEEKFRKATHNVDVLQDHLGEHSPTPLTVPSISSGSPPPSTAFTALQRQVTREAQQHKYELHGKLQELQEDIQDERDEKQAIYNEMTRQHCELKQQSSVCIQNLEEEVAELKLQLNNSQHAFLLLSEESHQITKEKNEEIKGLKKQIESLETEYEHILHSSLDQILSKLTLAGQQWKKESSIIHQQYKHMLQDCGLNPLDI